MASPKKVERGKQYHVNFIYNQPKLKNKRKDNPDWVTSYNVVKYCDELLTTWGYDKTYYHDRDALPGGNIFDEFFRALKSSSYTIVVVTRGFLTDCWVKYKSQSAFMNLLEHSNSNRFIGLYIDLDDFHIPDELNTCIPLEFSENWLEEKEEWVKLHSILSPVQKPTQDTGRDPYPQICTSKSATNAHMTNISRHLGERYRNGSQSNGGNHSNPQHLAGLQETTPPDPGLLRETTPPDPGLLRGTPDIDTDNPSSSNESVTPTDNGPSIRERDPTSEASAGRQRGAQSRSSGNVSSGPVIHVQQGNQNNTLSLATASNTTDNTDAAEPRGQTQHGNNSDSQPPGQATEEQTAVKQSNVHSRVVNSPSRGMTDRGTIDRRENPTDTQIDNQTDLVLNPPNMRSSESADSVVRPSVVILPSMTSSRSSTLGSTTHQTQVPLVSGDGDMSLSNQSDVEIDTAQKSLPSTPIQGTTVTGAPVNERLQDSYRHRECSNPTERVSSSHLSKEETQANQRLLECDGATQSADQTKLKRHPPDGEEAMQGPIHTLPQTLGKTVPVSGDFDFNSQQQLTRTEETKEEDSLPSLLTSFISSGKTVMKGAVNVLKIFHDHTN